MGRTLALTSRTQAYPRVAAFTPFSPSSRERKLDYRIRAVEIPFFLGVSAVPTK